MPYGRVDLVLDTAPSSAADVRRPGWTFALSCVDRGGVLSTGVWAAISLLAPQPDPEPGADRRLVARGRDEGALVGMPAATSQGCFMGRTGTVAAGALDGVVARAVYLHGVPDDGDPLIDTRRAVQHWTTALPQLSEYRIATRRAAWHVPLVERPSETVAAMLTAVS
jgi:hypothetical protein